MVFYNMESFGVAREIREYAWSQSGYPQQSCCGMRQGRGRLLFPNLTQIFNINGLIITLLDLPCHPPFFCPYQPPRTQKTAAAVHGQPSQPLQTSQPNATCMQLPVQHRQRNTGTHRLQYVHGRTATKTAPCP